MVRSAFASCFFVIVLLAGCTDGDSPGNTGGNGGAAGSGGGAGAGGSGGMAGAGGAGGSAGSAGTGGVGGDAGSGGSAGTGGMGGEGGSGGDGDDPNAITIDGRLFYGGDRLGLEGAIVLLNGDLTRSQTTDTDGRFRFQGVLPPYDLTVIDSNDWWQKFIEFKGLTRANPALSMSGSAAVRHSATVRGDIGGVAVPLPEGAEILVGLTQVESRISLWNRSPGVKLFGDFEWKGPASYSGSLVGLLTQMRTDGGLDFLQAGAITPFEIEAGAERTVDLILDQTVETEVTTIAANPGAYSFWTQAEFASFNILGATVPGEQHEVRLPLPEVVSIPAEGARIALVGFLPNFRAAAVVVADAVLDGETVLDLPDEVALDTIAPEDGAELTTTTPRLEWTPVPGALAYEVEVESGEWYGKWILPPTVTFLDVPDHGEGLLRLPSDREIWWTVVATTAAGHSPDELADPDGMGTPPFWATSREYMAQRWFSIVP